MRTYSVLVLGLGANGSSALYQLSKQKGKVCGIDQFSPPHNFGSSHGQSRIIRQAYWESPFYVPFIKRAYQLWYEIEKVSGKRLFLKTGGLMLGSADSQLVTGAKLSAQTHGIPIEELDFSSLKTRYPVFKIPEGTTGVVEKEAGILFPETCIHTYLEQAEKNGADIRLNETVTKVEPTESHVKVVTTRGEYTAEKLIISAGSWLPQLMPELSLPLTVERQVLYWFQNKPGTPRQNFSPDRLPIYIWEYEPNTMFYGFPDLGDGLKIAPHHGGRIIKPSELKNDATAEEIAFMKNITERFINMDPVFNYSVTCMYTNTPDLNFIIDYHPQTKRVIIASPCSGHGFKFASVTGEILSNMALEKPVDFDMSHFRINRKFS